LTYWNGKIVLIRGKKRGGEEERNCWDVCVAYIYVQVDYGMNNRQRVG
jgi:hypothetical protein